MQFEDTETNPNTGISGAEALINAGYPMIAGALSSSVSIQVAKQQTVPNGVVQCSPASTSPAITDLDDNNYMWRTPPTDALQSQVMADVGINRLENSTVSTFALNNDYGQGLANAFVSAWEDGGGTVQQEVSFEKAQSSYSSKLSTAMQDDPDMLMVVGYPESGVQIFRDFYSDYSQDAADVIVPDGLRAKSLPGDVGNSMRNVWGTAPKAAGPGQDYFADQFGGDPSAAFASQSFDAAAVLMLANAAAGENNGEAIRDEMMNVANPGGEEVTPESLVDGMSKAANGTEIQYKGVSGPVDFDENGDMKAAVYELFRYQEGGLESTDEIEFSK
jgi:ABC-type branched-subunit amino acid transport system substrate-binding protein